MDPKEDADDDGDSQFGGERITVSEQRSEKNRSNLPKKRRPSARGSSDGEYDDAGPLLKKAARRGSRSSPEVVSGSSGRSRSDPDLATTAGQAAANPHFTKEQCRAAAKREYNRQNAARARERNKYILAGLQEKVASLTKRVEELTHENRLLKTKVEFCDRYHAHEPAQRQQQEDTRHGVTAASLPTEQSLMMARVLHQQEQQQLLLQQQLLRSQLQGLGGAGSVPVAAAPPAATPNPDVELDPFRSLSGLQQQHLQQQPPEQTNDMLLQQLLLAQRQQQQQQLLLGARDAGVLGTAGVIGSSATDQTATGAPLSSQPAPSDLISSLLAEEERKKMQGGGS